MGGADLWLSSSPAVLAPGRKRLMGRLKFTNTPLPPSCAVQASGGALLGAVVAAVPADERGHE